MAANRAKKPQDKAPKTDPKAKKKVVDLQREEEALIERVEGDLEKLEELEKRIAEERDKFLRLFAEFENYKKRSLRERSELFKTAGREVLTALLPVLDDFERANREIAKSDDRELRKGVALIYDKLRETLSAKGLEPMAVERGDDFDTDLHEAITQIPAPSQDLSGKVIEVIEKGYLLNDKVIRFAKVVVGQ